MRTFRLLAACVVLTGALGVPDGPPGTAQARGRAGGPAAGPAGCGKAVPSDFDGDGYGDLAVADPTGRSYEAPMGSVHLLRGTSEGPPKVDASHSEMSNMYEPWSMSLADVDGDGCADLVVGSPHSTDSRYHAKIFWGGRRPVPPFTEIGGALDNESGFRDDSGRGWSVAAGKGVVVVSAPFEDADGVPGSGAVYVFPMRADRQRPDPIRITQDSPGVPGNSENGDMFGWSLALGRLGGAPEALDLVVGSPFEDTDGAGRQAGTGERDAGAVTILYDVTGDRLRGTRWNLAGVTEDVVRRENDRFGHALAYGEWRGTGYLAAGAPGADAGGELDSGFVQLFASAGGGVQPQSQGSRPYRSRADETRFGPVLGGDRRQANALGRQDGSGDLADPRPIRSLRQGAGALPDAAERLDGFGFSVAFAGGNLIVGSPFETDRGLPEIGAVTVVPLDGSPGSFVTEGRGRTQPYDHFGWSVSGAGDGWMAVGVPDERATGGGAVALVPLGGGDSHLLAPGYKGVPHLQDQVARRARPHEAGESVDFGAVVAG